VATERSDACARDQGLKEHVPEQAWPPSPPVAGCRPASTMARPVCTEQVTSLSAREPSACSVISAALGSSR
jgi:hypothetical protein